MYLDIFSENKFLSPIAGKEAKVCTYNQPAAEPHLIDILPW